jgi:hypothetical protein
MTAAVMTSVILLVVTPYILVDVYQCCGGYCHLKDKDIFNAPNRKDILIRPGRRES